MTKASDEVNAIVAHRYANWKTHARTGLQPGINLLLLLGKNNTLTSEILFLPREHKIHIFEPRVMFFLLYGETNSRKAKGGNRDRHSYSYATRVPDEVAYGIYEWFSSQ